MSSAPLTVRALEDLPPVIPIALADEVLGIGQTLSKRLRASGQYPVRVLPGLGRHHRVSTADLLAYLGVRPADRDSDGPQATVHLLPAARSPEDPDT